MEFKISSFAEINKGGLINTASKNFSKMDDEKESFSLKNTTTSASVSDEEAINALNKAESNNDDEDNKLPEEFAQRLDDKLGAGFADKLKEVADNNNMNVKDLVGLIYSESSFEPYVINDYGYIGFLQIKGDSVSENDYFTELGTTDDEYLEMTPIEQLDIVDRRLQFLISVFGKGHEKIANYTGGDMYALNFMPNNVFADDGSGNYKIDDGNGGGIFKDVNSDYGEDNLDYNDDGKLSTTEMQMWMEHKYEEALEWL